jgi:hypothetical protein
VLFSTTPEGILCDPILCCTSQLIMNPTISNFVRNYGIYKTSEIETMAYELQRLFFFGYTQIFKKPRLMYIILSDNEWTVNSHSARPYPKFHITYNNEWTSSCLQCLLETHCHIRKHMAIGEPLQTTQSFEVGKRPMKPVGGKGSQPGGRGIW